MTKIDGKTALLDEWNIESMHWLLDVDLLEDKCRVEDKTVQRNINILRKAAINLIRKFKMKNPNGKNRKRSFSTIMFDCLLDPNYILDVLKYARWLD